MFGFLHHLWSSIREQTPVTVIAPPSSYWIRVRMRTYGPFGWIDLDVRYSTYDDAQRFARHALVTFRDYDRAEVWSGQRRLHEFRVAEQEDKGEVPRVE